MGIVRLGTFGIFLSALLVVLGFLLISTGVFAEPKEVVEGPSEYSVQAVPESMDRRLEQMSISTMNSAKTKLELAAERACKMGDCSVVGITREELTDGIAHYTLTLSVGEGEYDRINVHRVVKEITPGLAEPTVHNLFMIHGDLWGFESAFMVSSLSEAVPVEQAMPIYLAQNDVDVWGIDLRFNNIPAGLMNYDFMAEQGIDTMMSDAWLAIDIARFTRMTTQQGIGKVNVLGWSRGGWLAYALANAETDLQNPQRRISGLIPVEAPYKVDPNDAYSVGFFCNAYSQLAGYLAGGVYQLDNATYILVGQLAETAPDKNSRLLRGYTNEQFAIGIGSLTFALITPITPTYHFTAGTFGPGKRQDLNVGVGRPEGLIYTDVALFIDALQLATPIESVRYAADTAAISCGATDVPYDDHLAEIDIPVLYVGAAGGIGELGLYTTTLLKAADLSVHLVQLEPSERALFDFGHSDLFQAAAAQWDVWEGVLMWLKRL